jgi:redox-sensitive bicupin YhaK (pirin superfamily)
VHPHKGFETVSILWEGALEHEDSSGGKGKLFAGDVQWMTAGAGILHKEFHETEFSKKGGLLHGAQLWVNLPAKDKSTPPAYQDIRSSKIPEITLPNGQGKIRIIAGEMNTVKGPANTFTRINIFDAHANAHADFDFHVTEGDNTAVLVLKGTVLINDDKTAREGDLLIFEQAGNRIHVQTNNETHLLLLSGEPITEPVAAYGPFVMNTQQEIIAAIDDFNAGKFGHLN